MSKTTKSQWDFGDLFPAAETRRVLSVAEVTTQVKRLLEQQIGQVWVTGEVTNLRAQASGHLYFTLKDAFAQLSCALFRGEAAGNRALLADGQKVLLQGQLTVYEPRGQYQLRVTEIELQGLGALQLAFERLKQKLNAEGLFAPERKRPLPRFPRRVGLVTSPTGAAVRDVLHVVQRRNPALELVLAPCRVQGQGAAAEIAAAINWLNQWHEGAAQDPNRCLDLILVTRGGGSLEDLWAFNEETVARAIYGSTLPIISAVGHEIDFTIGDLVADLRAATPSAAAELITEGVFSSRQWLADVAGRLPQFARRVCARARNDYGYSSERLLRAHPRARLNESWQRLDDLQASLTRGVRSATREAILHWQGLHAQWLHVRPSQMLGRRRELLVQLHRRLGDRAKFGWQTRQHRWATLAARLRLLSPEMVLARGYSITLDTVSGKVIRAAGDTVPGQALRTRLHQGEVRSVVTLPR